MGQDVELVILAAADDIQYRLTPVAAAVRQIFKVAEELLPVGVDQPLHLQILFQCQAVGAVHREAADGEAADVAQQLGLAPDQPGQFLGAAALIGNLVKVESHFVSHTADLLQHIGHMLGGGIVKIRAQQRKIGGPYALLLLHLRQLEGALHTVIDVVAQDDPLVSTLVVEVAAEAVVLRFQQRDQLAVCCVCELHHKLSLGNWQAYDAAFSR